MTEPELPARAAGEMLGTLFDQVAVGVAELDPNGRCLRVNRHLRRMLGYSDGASLPAMLDDLTHPDDRDVDHVNFELMSTGAVDEYRQERRLRRFDGSFLWVESSMSAIRKIDGSLDRLAAVVYDISRFKEVEQRQWTLLEEMAHRGRNLFAILKSLARYSLTDDRPPSEAYRAFEGRLGALSESMHGLLRKDSGGIRLDQLVRRELHFLGTRATVEGPEVIVTPNAARLFALILHELSTNSTKYGALSTTLGTLLVRWSVIEAGDTARFIFEWRESGGPPPPAPSRRGFGTFLTTEVVGADFDCAPSSNYGAGGFDYRFDAPLTRVGTLVVESFVRRRLKSPVTQALYDAWSRDKDRVGGLPSLARFDWTPFAATGAMTVGKVERDGAVRITQVGRTLIERLGRPLAEEEIEMVSLDGARELYERCARKASPCHEYLRFGFGDGEPLALERLLVPFVESPGGPVSHVIGIAIFTGNTKDPCGGASGTRDRSA